MTYLRPTCRFVTARIIPKIVSEDSTVVSSPLPIGTIYAMARRSVNHGYRWMIISRTYQQSDYQRPYWEMGGPQLNAEAGEDEVDREKDGIPPFRNLAIVGH